MKTNTTILTVSELTRRIKGVLESGFGNISIQGEISNFKKHSSGHLYFTLKDESSQLNAVMWRSRAGGLFFTPQDGMKVIVKGNITVYEVRGVYQIDVIQIQPLGVGELQMAFERLKQKLADEGIFDQEHKKEIPQYPERIGIVTSSTGAAIRDIVNIITRRYPAVDLILYPVKVQGEGAAEEVAEAIEHFNEYGNIDVLIVGRGGGSLEDLWAFNEEVVARAIYRSKIPIVSAVGHEIDFTIADFVADLRAPTPSAAAELVVPNRLDLIEFIRNFYYNSTQRMQEILKSNRENIQSIVRSYAFNRPVDMVRQYSQRLDEINRTLDRSMGHRFTILQQHIISHQQRISSANPKAILKRGYVLVMKNGEYVQSTKKLQRNDDVKMHFHDGELPAKIQ